MNRRREKYTTTHIHTHTCDGRRLGRTPKVGGPFHVAFFFSYFSSSSSSSSSGSFSPRGLESMSSLPPSRWNTTQRIQRVKRFQEFNLFSVLFRYFFRYANPTEKSIQWARSAREFSAKLIIPIVWNSNYFAVNFTFFSTQKVTTFAGRRKKNVEKLVWPITPKMSGFESIKIKFLLSHQRYTNVHL